MRWILAFFIIGISFIIFFVSRWMWTANQARRKGRIPKDGKLTMFHVRQLIIENEMDLAVETYCRLFSTNRAQAQKAVEDLQKSIQEKKS